MLRCIDIFVVNEASLKGIKCETHSTRISFHRNLSGTAWHEKEERVSNHLRESVSAWTKTVVMFGKERGDSRNI